MIAQTQGGRQSWLQVNPKVGGNRLAQYTRGVAFLAKPFSDDYKESQDLFFECLGLVLKALELIPSHADLRKSTLVFIHHMVPSLELQDLLKLLPRVFDIYLAHVNSENVSEVIQLVTRMSSMFKRHMRPLFDVYLLKVINAIFACLAEYDAQYDKEVPDSAISHLKSGKREIQKYYYQFMIALTGNELCSSLVSKSNAPHLEKIVGSIIEGTKQPPDPKVHQMCFQIFRLMVEDWAPFTAINGFYQYLTPLVIQVSFESPMQQHFKLEDAAAHRCVKEIAQLHVSLFKTFKEAGFIDALGRFMINTLRYSQDVAKDYCISVAQGNNKKKLMAIFQDLKNR